MWSGALLAKTVAMAGAALATAVLSGQVRIEIVLLLLMSAFAAYSGVAIVGMLRAAWVLRRGVARLTWVKAVGGPA